jgi:hypothetical protein
VLKETRGILCSRVLVRAVFYPELNGGPIARCRFSPGSVPLSRAWKPEHGFVPAWSIHRPKKSSLVEQSYSDDRPARTPNTGMPSIIASLILLEHTRQGCWNRLLQSVFRATLSSSNQGERRSSRRHETEHTKEPCRQGSGDPEETCPVTAGIPILAILSTASNEPEPSHATRRGSPKGVELRRAMSLSVIVPSISLSLYVFTSLSTWYYIPGRGICQDIDRRNRHKNIQPYPWDGNFLPRKVFHTRKNRKTQKRTLVLLIS